MMTIRPATRADLDAACALLERVIAGMRAAGIEQWDEIYPTRAVLAADIDADTMFIASTLPGTLAGLIVLNDEQNIEYAEVPWHFAGRRIGVVHRLMVDPAAERRGVARALMAHLERRATELGCDVLRLDAFTQNPRALRLYPALGYRDAGGIRLRKGPFRCFEKRLSGGE